MWPFKAKKQQLAPGESTQIELTPMPTPAEGQTSFDQAREHLGLPSWWKDEWFLPGEPGGEEIQREIERHREKKS